MSSAPADFSKYFSEAAEQTFETQASIKTTVERVAPNQVKGDLVASIGLIASKMTGSVSFIFPKEPFLHLSNTMLGETAVEISAENSDAASEILNIVYGIARRKMNQDGFDFLPAIPTVVRGKSIEVSNRANSCCFHFSFEAGHGPFYLIGCFEARNG